LIEVHNLVKRYSSRTLFRHDPTKDIVALAGISFEVKKGEIFALLGLNGAGKTTTLRILTTMLKPSSGTATVGGHDVVKQRYQVSKIIGVVGENAGLYDRLSTREHLRFFGRLNGMSTELIQERTEQLFTMLDIDYGDRTCERLSKGQKQKAAICRALIHSPPVLILDEPTSGLDVVSANVIVEALRSIASKGTTILLSTHSMHVVEALAKRIAVIQNGILVRSGKLEECMTGYSTLEALVLDLLGDIPMAEPEV